MITSDKQIGRTKIIAEIGKNFIQTEEEKTVDEYLENAKKLVLEAKSAGADIVKFQTHNVEDEILNIKFNSPHFSDSDRYSWVKRNTSATPLKEFWIPLKAFCCEKNISFFSTPMSRGAAQILTELEVDKWKVGSGDIMDFVLLDYLCSTGKTIFISSGMSTFKEIKKVVNLLKSRNIDTVLFHCVSKYPCPPEELNLSLINFYKDFFKIPVGFSDHSLDNNSAIASVVIGADYVEKHFTLSRNLYGSDHKISQTPKEFRNLVDSIRRIESDESYKNQIINSEQTLQSVGQGDKVLVAGESDFRPIFRKSLVASKKINKGDIIDFNSLYAMRPQSLIGGLPSDAVFEIIGKKSKVSLEKFDTIEKDNLL